MTTVISAQKVGNPLPDGNNLLGDRWTSIFVNDHLWFISLNSINQPTFRSRHDTPLFGGVILAFDIRQGEWRKEIIYDPISCEENLEGRIFGFRHTLLLLTYRKHGAFSYENLYYWDQDQSAFEKGKWKLNSLFIDPQTQLSAQQHGEPTIPESRGMTELILAESDDYVYLLVHDRMKGAVLVSQLDTVGGYGRPGPARIDFLFEIQNESLIGETSKILCSGIFDQRLWILFFGHQDPAGAAARLLSIRVKDGRVEEIDLNATVGGGSVLTKPFVGNEKSASLENGDGEQPSKFRWCRNCHTRPHDQGKLAFSHGLCASHWVFLVDSDHGNEGKELWGIDLREGRWSLLAAPKSHHHSIAEKFAKAKFKLSIPDDATIAAWDDADLEFFGIGFNSEIYRIDVKKALDEF